jgi:hypothetical protein
MINQLRFEYHRGFAVRTVEYLAIFWLNKIKHALAD